MPKGKAYSTKSVKMGGSKTPASVMGNQGHSVKVTSAHTMRPTGNTPFPGGNKSTVKKNPKKSR